MDDINLSVDVQYVSRNGSYKPHRIKFTERRDTCVEYHMEGTTAIVSKINAPKAVITKAMNECEKLPFVQAVDREL